MSAEFIHIDQAHDAMVETINELNRWIEIAHSLYHAVCCEKTLRESGFTDPSQCHPCTEAINNYKKAADAQP